MKGQVMNEEFESEQYEQDWDRDCPECHMPVFNGYEEEDPWDGWYMPGYPTEMDYLNSEEANDYLHEDEWREQDEWEDDLYHDYDVGEWD